LGHHRRCPSFCQARFQSLGHKYLLGQRGARSDSVAIGPHQGPSQPEPRAHSHPTSSPWVFGAIFPLQPSLLATLLGTNLGARGLAPLQRRGAPPQSPSNPLSSPLVVSSAFCSEVLRHCVLCAFVRSFRSLNCCSLFFVSLTLFCLPYRYLFALPLLASPPHPFSTTSFVPPTTKRRLADCQTQQQQQLPRECFCDLQKETTIRSLSCSLANPWFSMTGLS